MVKIVSAQLFKKTFRFINIGRVEVFRGLDNQGVHRKECDTWELAEWIHNGIFIDQNFRLHHLAESKVVVGPGSFLGLDFLGNKLPHQEVNAILFEPMPIRGLFMSGQAASGNRPLGQGVLR